MECRKKIQQHSASIDWRQNNLQNIQTWTPIRALCMHTQSIKMAYKPSSKAVPFPDIFWKYGALLFQDRLGDFITAINNLGLGMHALHTHSANTLLPFCTVHVYHNIKFRAANDAQELEIVDAIHVWLEQKDKHGQIIPAQFDTVLVQSCGEGECFSFTLRLGSRVTHSPGYWVAQVRIVFEIPTKIVLEVFRSVDPPPKHLAYIEWFTPIPVTPNPKHSMYRVSRKIENGKRSASVIRVESIIRSVYLILHFGPVKPHKWHSFTVLKLCNTFYINLFSDIQNYLEFA